jgi:predicted O-methyltransferase YrrM
MADKAVLEALARIEQRLDNLEQRLQSLALRDIQWGLIHTSQQLEKRQMLAYRLDVPEGWLPATRGWAASADFLLIVADLVRELEPKGVVECGSGVSTVILSQLLKDKPGVKLVSFDHDVAFAQKTAQMLQERGLAGHIDISIAAAPMADHSGRFKWYSTEGVPLPEQIDLLLVDGPIVTQENPLARYPALPLLESRLSANAVVVLDDAARPGEQETLRRWQQEYPGWQIEMMPTEKGTAVMRRRQG